MINLRVAPAGPYSLAEASRRFFHGWAAIAAGEGEPVRVAMLRDDLAGAVGVALREEDGAVVAEVEGDGDPAALERQIARIMSLDHDGTAFPEVGRRDPVVGRAMAAAPGLRPVCFNTPYEAACWAILSQRTALRQTAAVRRRLSERYGEAVSAGGVTAHAFPLPEALLAAPELPGVPGPKVEWLRAVAEAALEGRLDADELRAVDADAARAELRAVPGLGPFSADLVLMRGCGAVDVASPHEPRLRRAVADAYGVDLDDAAAFVAVTERWRPFRTWTSVLVRVVGEEAAAGR